MFYFRLAGHLHCTVAELLRRISSKELTEWMAFYRIEPFGDVRADIRAARIACVTATAWLKKKDGTDFLIQDFMMPKFGAEIKKTQTPKEMAAILKAFAERHKGE